MPGGAPGTRTHQADHDRRTKTCTAALAACSLDKWRFIILLFGVDGFMIQRGFTITRTD